ncbi:hypothetical protein ACFVXG_30760 [Kitasatospora sp. NPDC058162]|uniref:hypothetical protein n=1 Tax=Kitasatospora sp. NPDC058162 TaxID=3346362 RepID=UPI0036DCA707
MPTVPADPSLPPPPLENSAREVLKGTLVPVKFPTTLVSETGTGSLSKIVAIRQFALEPGETEQVRERLRAAEGVYQRGGSARSVSAATLDLLTAFEAPLVPALMPDLAAASRVPAHELKTFAEVLVDLRAERLRWAQERSSDVETGRSAWALNTAVVAVRGLDAATPPVGMLNLERIEMVPSGIERGQLLATIPLSPLEETAVTQTEWSVTSKEFTTIVTDSLEQVSETGVTDNTDLAQSTSSQSQHSNQFNITGTVQGGIPVISGSSTASFTAQDAKSASATDSIKHARSTTQKASTRSRQEHKMTISTKTETGTSESSTRQLKNPSQTQPMRIDYFSLMRKWRVRLYRYGLRLTYDIVIPEPGAAMRRAYAELDTLRGQQGSFDFSVKHSDITTDAVNPAGLPDPNGVPKYKWLADQYGATVRPYPTTPAPVQAGQHVVSDGHWWFLDVEFDVPEGTRITDVVLDAQVGHDGSNLALDFDVIGVVADPAWHQPTDPVIVRGYHLKTTAGTSFLLGETGHQKVTVFTNHAERMFAGLTASVELDPTTVEQWRNDVWTALFDAAQARYLAHQEEISAQIAAIEDQLSNVDTLTLRREESDEIMKSVLRFILGPTVDLMPADVIAAFLAAGVDLPHGIGFDDPTLGLTLDQWTLVRQHEDVIRFINEAIEWENVVSFLYSYFWDVPPAWQFIRALRHPDANRQAFLRAGSARVVLTVRKGWEEAWMRYAVGGSIGATIPAPYLSVAQEIAAYDDRNYPGIPPANPARTATRLQDAVYTTCSANIAPSTTPVIVKVDSSANFVVGLPVLLDVADERGIQEAVLITAVPGPNQIVLEKVQFAHNGTSSPFPVLQPGEKGALIAEWGEYTPTSGTDIAITSDLSGIG